jgi:hypothetical protein
MWVVLQGFELDIDLQRHLDGHKHVIHVLEYFATEGILDFFFLD